MGRGIEVCGEPVSGLRGASSFPLPETIGLVTKTFKVPQPLILRAPRLIRIEWARGEQICCGGWDIGVIGEGGGSLRYAERITRLRWGSVVWGSMPLGDPPTLRAPPSDFRLLKKRARQDSNLRPTDSKSGALSKLSYGRVGRFRGGNRTQLMPAIAIGFKPSLRIGDRSSPKTRRRGIY